jgi:hypothetical protein
MKTSTAANAAASATTIMTRERKVSQSVDSAMSLPVEPRRQLSESM